MVTTYDYDRRSVLGAALFTDKLEEGLQEIKGHIKDLKQAYGHAKEIAKIVGAMETHAKKVVRDQVHLIDELEERVAGLLEVGKSKHVEEALKDIRRLKGQARADHWQVALSVDSAISRAGAAVNGIALHAGAWVRKNSKKPPVKAFIDFVQGDWQKAYKAREAALKDAAPADDLAHKIYSLIQYVDVLMPYHREDLDEAGVGAEIRVLVDEYNSYRETVQPWVTHFQLFSPDIHETAAGLEVNMKEWVEVAERLVKELDKAIFK